MAYDAFISYSHSADGLVAPALQTALQRFAKPWWKPRAVKIFRDETSLSASHDLTLSIRSALDSSRFFILLASPGSARSKWVEREARLWLAEKKPDQILIVLTEGTILWDEAGDFDWSRTNALPRALAGAFKSEPLWVDLTWARGDEQLSSRDPRFQQAVARLAAPLHGKSLDEISGEEVRQHRKTRRLAQGAVAAIAILAAAAMTGGWFARVGQLRAERNLGQALAALDSIETSVAKDLQDLSGVQVSLRLKMLKTVEDVLSRLDTGGEASAEGLTRAVMLSEFAAAYGTLGSYAEATSRAQEAIKILAEQEASHPGDAVTLAALAKSHKVYGDVLWLQRKSLSEAVAQLKSGVAAYAALIEAHPGHADADEWTLFEYRSLIGVGDVYFDAFAHPSGICEGGADCLDRAKAAFTSALDIASAQTIDGPDFHWRNARLVGRERLAKTLAAQGNQTLAGDAYADLLREYQAMSEAQPENSKWKENLVAIYWRVGGLEESACRLDAAYERYAKALEIARALHQLEPERIDWSRELSMSLINTARTRGGLGQTAQAETEYQASLALLQDLIAAQPANADLKADQVRVQAALSQLGGAPPPCAASPAR